MDRQAFEALLWQQEGDALDFKKGPYRFQKGTDDEKGEVLKDILALVNAWRPADAHILIGVEEARGGRAVVHGVPEADHPPEHCLQEFVNSKANAPVRFTYEVFDHDGAGIGVITVPRQARPRYPKQAYGRLEKNAVYVRRGSATVTASPDEVARMGAADVADPAPALAAHLKHEIEENVRTLFTVSSAGRMTPKSYEGSFVRTRFQGGLDDSSNYLGKHLGWLGVFLTFGLGEVRNLRTDALADAVSSGRFLDLDRGTGTYTVGALQRGMLALQNRLGALSRAAGSGEASEQGRRLILENRGRQEREVWVRNRDLLIACCLYDQFEHVTALLRAVYRGLDGDDSLLRSVEPGVVSPIREMSEGIEAETPTPGMISDWLRS